MMYEHDLGESPSQKSPDTLRALYEYQMYAWLNVMNISNNLT